MFDSGLCERATPLAARRREVLRVQPDAVRRDDARAEKADRVEPLRRRRPVLLEYLPLLVPRLRDVDEERRPELVRERPGGDESLLRAGVRRVRRDGRR